MLTDFELCSYSISSIEKCENYGSRFCKTCARYWCNDHRCIHILAFDSMDDERSEESERSEDIDTSVGFNFISTSNLRLRRDKLFNELKALQHELDLREDSAEAIARETSTANLNKWLKDQGYEQNFKRVKQSNNKSNLFRDDRIHTFTNKSMGNKKQEAKKAIQALFNKMSERQIKAFVEQVNRRTKE